MTSTFDPTLQHLEATERFEQALTRVRAVCGEKFDGRRLAPEESDYTKNGMLAEIYKALVYGARRRGPRPELTRIRCDTSRREQTQGDQRGLNLRLPISQFCRKCIAAAHRTEYIPPPEWK